MKFDKIVIASLLLVILTIGAVSASDENVTNDNLAVSGNLQVIEVDSPVGSFSNLSDEINSEQSDNIILKNNYQYDPTVDDENGILINRSMAINGDGHYIDASDSFRVFDIQTDNFVLENIVIKNLGRGGALNCNAYNCTFIGATVESDTLFNGNFYDCTFIDCHSNRGIKIFNGTAYSSKFINCTGWGGSDAVLDNLVECTLVNFQDSSNITYIQIEILTGDKSKYMADNSACVAVNFESMNSMDYVLVTIDNSTREMQSCTIGDAEKQWEINNLSPGIHTVFVQFKGNKIYPPVNLTSTFTILPESNQTIKSIADLIKLIDNAPKGGILELDKDYIYTNDYNDIQINKTIAINGNNHKIDAMNNDLRIVVYSPITLNNVQFENWGNISANATMGIMEVHTVGCNISNCKFINITTYEKSVLYSTESNLTIDSCKFIDCNSMEHAILYSENSNLKVTNTDFIDNNNVLGTRSYYTSSYDSNPYDSISDAGALYIAGDDAFVSNCNFINNTGYIAGAILVTGNRCYIANSTFENNKERITKSDMRWYDLEGNETKWIDYNDTAGAIKWDGNDGILENPFMKNNQGYTDFNFVGENGKIINTRYKIYAPNVTIPYLRFGESYEYVVKLTDNNQPVEGVKLTFNIFGDESTATTDSEGEVHRYLEFTSVGTWNMTLRCDDNDRFHSCNATATFTVIPLNTSLYLNIEHNFDKNVTYENGHYITELGHEVLLLVGLDGVDGGVVSYFDGETLLYKDDLDELEWAHDLYVFELLESYIPTTLGEHIISAKFTGNNYHDSNSSVILYVTKAKSHLSIDKITTVCFSNPSNFAVNVISGLKGVNEGNVKYYINNQLIGTSEVINGLSNLSYTSDSAGLFNLEVVFEESDNYTASIISTTFNVTKMPTTLTGESVVFDEESSKTFTIELKDNNNRGISGQTVKIEAVKSSGESKTFTGISDSNGTISYDVNDLAGGMWIVRGIYEGNNNYLASNFTDKFIAIRMNTTTTIDEIKDPYIGYPIHFHAEIHDESGNPVNEGEVHYYLDGNDLGYIDLANHEAHTYIEYNPTATGNHTLSVVYEGTSLYRPSNQTTTFIVKESLVSTEITASGFTTVYNSGKYLVATLKDSYGNPVNGVEVIVKFSNGKTDAQTVKNGQVKFSTNGLNPVKTYKATIIFAGNSKYDNSTKTVNVKINKATPKITAKAKTFKKSVKTKKYSVTLNVNQKVKVAIKVNKRTYYAYTTTKGKATFKITKLTKKGKYTATVSSIGNKYYNKAKSVNVKITVK